MKKRSLTLFLTLGAALGLLLSTAHAGTPDKPPQDAIFSMSAEAEAPQSGNRIDVVIRGGTVSSGPEKMASFQFTLDYPEGLELLSVRTPLPGLFVQDKGRAVYSAAGPEGVELSQTGTVLAVASFRVRTEKPDRFTVRLNGAEITRLQDDHSSLQPTVPAEIIYTPMVQIGSAADGTVSVLLHNNPQGTLIASVYDAEGRMLESAVKTGVPASAGEPQQLALDLTDGASVRVFLLDDRSCPLGPEARAALSPQP